MDWNKIYDANNDNPQREKFKIKLSEEDTKIRVDIDYKYECYSRRGWKVPNVENMNTCLNNFISIIKETNVNKIKLREYKYFEVPMEKQENIKENKDINKNEKEILSSNKKENNNQIKQDDEALSNNGKKSKKKLKNSKKEDNIEQNKNSNVSKVSLTELQKSQVKKYTGISYDKLYSTMLKNLKAEYKNIKIANKKTGNIETMWIYPKGKDKLTATKRLKVFIKFKNKSKTTTVVTMKMEKNNNSVWEKVTLSDKQQISMYTNLYKKLETNLK